MLYLFLVAAGLILFLLLAIDHVKNRFEHTTASRRALRIEFAASLLVGVALAYWLFELGSVVWYIMVGSAMGLPLFVFSAYITVEVWRRRKQKRYDDKLRHLTADASRVREELQRIAWQERDFGQKRSRIEVRNRDRLEAQSDIRRQLTEWERGGGLARLRTIKVRDWQEEFEQLSPSEVAAKRDELQKRLLRAGGDEAEQLRAQLHVLELLAIGDNLSGPGEELAKLDAGLGELRQSRRELEQELAVLEDELEEWRRRKAQFLGDKIKLE